MSEHKSWKVGKADEDGVINILKPVADGNGYQLAAEAYDEADARLIAAAHELLEAIEDLVKSYNGLRRCEGYGDDPSDSLDAARDAIAKAKGHD